MLQAGKELYLIGNWKSNKTLTEAEEFFHELRLPELPPHIHVVICPPFPHLYRLSAQVELGAQDVSPFSFGAYTGAVAADMLKDVCGYAIVGHSERRKYFHETNQDVGNKARLLLDAGITPILCVDEPYLDTQLAVFTDAEMKRMIIAYEPLAAIGSGTPDTPDHANSIAERIQQLAQAEVPVLYGGSVTPDSVRQFVETAHIQGVLVGGASLSADTWSRLIHQVI